jgi:hypothetical protein
MTVTLAMLAFRPGSAQSPEGHISGTVKGPEVGMVVMVSCLQNGDVYFQQETRTGYNFGCPARPPGTYEVRIEGDGLVTQEKRGIRVFAGQRTALQFQLIGGTGVRIIEYSAGGLPREEVAARLQEQELHLAVLQAQVAQTFGTSASGGDPPPCCQVIDIDETNLTGTAQVNGFSRIIRFRFENQAQLLRIRNRAGPSDARTTGTVKWHTGSAGRLWSFAAQGKIGFAPADPCCTIVAGRP